MSATATLGLVQLWDVDGGLAMIDKYLYSSEDYIKVHIMLIVFEPLVHQARDVVSTSSLTDYMNIYMFLGFFSFSGWSFAGVWNSKFWSEEWMWPRSGSAVWLCRTQ